MHVAEEKLCTVHARGHVACNMEHVEAATRVARAEKYQHTRGGVSLQPAHATVSPSLARTVADFIAVTSVLLRHFPATCLYVCLPY